MDLFYPLFKYLFSKINGQKLSILPSNGKHSGVSSYSFVGENVLVYIAQRKSSHPPTGLSFTSRNKQVNYKVFKNSNQVSRSTTGVYFVTVTVKAKG